MAPGLPFVGRVRQTARRLLGLDIGSSAIKVIELIPDGKGHRVLAFSAEPAPPDSIVDGAILDASAVSSAVRRLLESGGNDAPDVVTSLAGSAVMVKRICLPRMTDRELGDTIHWEAERYVPYPIHDVNLDYHALGPDSSGKDAMDVLLVAAKKERVAEYVDVVGRAGRRVAVLDINAFALQNAYEANYGYAAGTVVMLLDAGASFTTVCILAGNQTLFSRDLAIGGDAYGKALQRELSLPADAADRLKHGHDAEGVSFDAARPVLRAVTEHVTLEIEKTVDYFAGTAASDRIDTIFVTGGASRAEGLAESLGERFRAPVAFMNPFRRIAWDALSNRSDCLEAAATAAVAVGLALRSAGDR